MTMENNNLENKNDDVSFTIMQTWNRLLIASEWVQAGIVLACGIGVGKDTCKYIKNRKEKEV